MILTERKNTEENDKRILTYEVPIEFIYHQECKAPVIS